MSDREPRVFQVQLMGQCHACGNWEQPVRGYRVEYAPSRRVPTLLEHFHHEPSFYCHRCAVKTALKILELESL